MFILKGLCNTVYDYVSEVEVPKKIVIRNVRLGIVLNLLNVLVVLLIIWLVTDKDAYLRQVETIGRVAKWVESRDVAYNAAAEEDFQKDICKDPSNSHYQFDTQGEWVYSNHTCLRKPKEQRRGWKEGSNTLYVPTAYTETHTKHRNAPTVSSSNGDVADCSNITDPCPDGWMSIDSYGVDNSDPVCECKSTANYWIVGVSSVELGLDHNYVVMHKANWFRLQFSDLGSSQASYSKCDSHNRWHCASDDDMMTIVVVTKWGKEKEFHRSISPAGISLPLQDLLTASGVSLDMDNEETRQNVLHCDVNNNPDECIKNVKLYPIVRQTGVEIFFDVEYMNSHFPDGVDVDGHDGPLCFIRVTVRPSWTGMPVHSCDTHGDTLDGENDCVLKYYYGVQFVFAVSGSFGFIDFVNLAQHLGSGLAYFILPVLLVSGIAMRCLGPVSRIYRNAGYQKVDISHELATLVAKMVSMSQAFENVAGGGKYVSQSALYAEVEKTFGNTELDKHEMKRLTNLVYHEMEGGPMLQAAGQNPDDGPSAAIGIDKGHFVTLANRMVSLTEAVKLFDRSRRRSCLERIFKPEISAEKKAREIDLEADPGTDEASPQ